MNWFSARPRRSRLNRRTVRRPGVRSGCHERVAATGAGFESLEHKLPLAADTDVDITPAEDLMVSVMSVTAPRVLAITEAGSPGSSSRIRVLNAETLAQITEFQAFEAGFRGGVQAVVGDVDGDGTNEIAAASGAGRAGEIRVYTASGSELVQYRTQPFGPGWHRGVNLAVGDVDGDGRGDLIAAKARGDGEVRIFRSLAAADPIGATPYRIVRAFPAGFEGGATVATADFGSFTNGVATAATVPDGRFELVLGSGATTRATVRVYDLSSSTPRVIDTIRPFGNDAQGGVWVNVARVDRDITPDIIVGAGQRGGGKVEVYDGTVTQAPNPKLHSLNAFASLGSSSAPVEASGGDIDNDGIADLLYVTRRGEGLRTLSFAGVLSNPLGGSANADLFAAGLPTVTPGTTVTTPSGLKYRDVVVGQGARPSSPSATVRVNYDGRLLNGFRFDSNRNSSFGLQQVIAGWTEGLPTMQVGGIRQLIIPANLAYGATARTGIPANSTLVFDVELLATT